MSSREISPVCVVRKKLCSYWNSPLSNRVHAYIMRIEVVWLVMMLTCHVEISDSCMKDELQRKIIIIGADMEITRPHAASAIFFDGGVPSLASVVNGKCSSALRLEPTSSFSGEGDPGKVSRCGVDCLPSVSGVLPRLLLSFIISVRKRAASTFDIASAWHVA
jgi:hypothetical protein